MYEYILKGGNDTQVLYRGEGIAVDGTVIYMKYGGWGRGGQLEVVGSLVASVRFNGTHTQPLHRVSSLSLSCRGGGGVTRRRAPRGEGGWVQRNALWLSHSK